MIRSMTTEETLKAAMELFLSMMESKGVKVDGEPATLAEAASNYRYTLAAAKVLEAVELLKKC